MIRIRNLALGALLALFVAGAWVQQVAEQPGRLERVHPNTQTIRTATPDEARVAELHRQLELWRAQLQQPDAEVIQQSSP